jgi:Flp pilus assembly protein TadD
MCEARMKNHDQAIKDFSEAIRLQPKSSKAYCERGWILAQIGNFDKALLDYT